MPFRSEGDDRNPRYPALPLQTIQGYTLRRSGQVHAAERMVGGGRPTESRSLESSTHFSR